MREIKFRVWDKKEKKMHTNVSIINNASAIRYDEFESQKERPIMQYTGLKDKNGVEIYEGDIIRHFWKAKRKDKGNIIEREEIFSIEWGYDEGGYESPPFWGWTQRERRKGEKDDITSFIGIESMQGANRYFLLLEEKYEVIGNIHENPELLE